MKKKHNPNYDEVSSKTWNSKDLKKKNLKNSVSLFEYKNKNIIPKRLEVIALLSGLPFSRKLTNKIISTQKKINLITRGIDQYWVKKNNLGLEYCVFKWPHDNVEKIKIQEISNFISKLNIPKFHVLFDGCQLNPDGCVVVRGYDVSKKIYYLRNLVKNNISNIPKKQSSWYHIPIGRILEPVGSDNFKKLKNFFYKNFEGWNHLEEIKNLKLIHEFQWYMETRKTLISVKNK